MSFIGGFSLFHSRCELDTETTGISLFPRLKSRPEWALQMLEVQIRHSNKKFWKNLKTPIRHFEIKWPLLSTFVSFERPILSMPELKFKSWIVSNFHTLHDHPKKSAITVDVANVPAPLHLCDTNWAVYTVHIRL